MVVLFIYGKVRMDAGISLGRYNLSMLRRVGRRSVHEGCVVYEGGVGIGFFLSDFFGFPLINAILLGLHIYISSGDAQYARRSLQTVACRLHEQYLP
jgi:hypothetical protein